MRSGRNVRWVAAAIGGAAAAGVAALSAGDAGRAVDRSLFARLNADRGPAADGFFRGVTELGSIGARSGPFAAFAARGRGRADDARRRDRRVVPRPVAEEAAPP
jgi:hypothetical protein